jgi:polysaccharide biosynthesis/export protein
MMRKYSILILSLFLLAPFLQIGAASAETYLVRRGDTLEVLVWQDPKLSRQVIVAPDGSIAIPLAGHVRAAGRSMEAIEADLKAKLKDQFSDDLDITVTLLAQKEKPVEPMKPEEPPIDPSIYVVGEVAKPGQYYFKTRTNVLQAIALAGGLGPFAAESRIKIRRKQNGEEMLYDFDYDAFTSGEDMSGNIGLKSGDVIIVPEKGLFE